MPRIIPPEERIIINIPDYDGTGIYRIENIRTGKAYVGSSVNIRMRIKNHDLMMRRGLCNAKFLEDVKAGDKFKVTVLEKMGIPSRYELYEREQYYIAIEDLYHNGYNTASVHTRDMAYCEQYCSGAYEYMNQPMVNAARKRKTV